jgi:hypothetical protein
MAPASGVAAPTGNVQFFDAGATLGTLAVGGSNGVSTAQTTVSLGAGSHSLSAAYLGDANYGPSTSAGSALNVAKATPVVTVGGGPCVYNGNGCAASASVTGVGGVTLVPGSGSLAVTYSLNGGTPFGAPPVAAGTYAVTATFTSSNANYANATGAGTIVINKAGTSTTLTSSQNPSASGASLTFTAAVTAVSPGAGLPTGTVTFRDGTTILGTGTLSNGTASFSTSTLSAGTHSITAVYGGDANFNGSTSAALTQTVKAAYTFIGFQTPLTTAGTLSSPSSSGSSSYSRVLPVKWQLLDSAGKNVTALTSTTLLSAWFSGATCPGAGTPPPGVDANTVILYSPTQGAAGGSTFRSGSSGFIFNWDATKGSKGKGCYWIRLKLDDGSAEKVTTVLLQ